MKNQIHIRRDYGWFIGCFDNNQQHKHYAIQVSIPIDKSISISSPKKSLSTKFPVLIQSNAVHQIVSSSRHFLLLLNPASTIGHFWKNMSNNEIQEVNIPPASDLQNILTNYDSLTIPVKKLNTVIEKYDCFCSSAVHQGDERINKALTYLNDHFDRVVYLEEIASYCHISPSRFLHLFKEQTGITFRRAQQWTKLTKGLPLIGKKSFTEIAHQIGFSDSAHLSRVFKENFGFGPREFLKFSQFIQV